MLEVECFALDVVFGVADEDDLASELVLEDCVRAGGSDVAAADDGDACAVRGHGSSFLSDIFAVTFHGARKYLTPCLLPEFDLGGALSALVLRRLCDGGDIGMAAEIFAEGAAEDAHACAMHDADAGQAGEEGAVDETFHFGLGLVGGAANHIDL